MPPLPILRENKTKFLKKKKIKNSNFQYTKYLPNSSKVLSTAVSYTMSHSDNNEQKDMLLFQSHTVGLHGN